MEFEQRRNLNKEPFVSREISNSRVWMSFNARFLECTRSNCVGALHTVFGTTLCNPVWQAWFKVRKSLPGTKINMCTATDRSKEVDRPSLTAYLRGIGKTFPMSYHQHVGWHFWPSSTRHHIPLTRSLASGLVLNFAHFSLLNLSGDPCVTVSVLLRFRLDQGFNMSYQWPDGSKLRPNAAKKSKKGPPTVSIMFEIPRVCVCDDSVWVTKKCSICKRCIHVCDNHLSTVLCAPNHRLD